MIHPQKLFVLSCALLCTTLSHAASMSPSEYGPTYVGDGTYYGYTDAGNCAMRGKKASMYHNMLPVAINDAQYGNSERCGACIKITKGGRGLGANPIDTSRGPIMAYVHDRCPECGFGALDLSKSGDGRWHVEWEFVQCPPGDGTIQVLFEGSNQWYRKMQFRGTRSPIVNAVAAGITGGRSQDNFFIFQNGGGWPRNVRVELTTVLHGKVTFTLGSWKTDGLIEVRSAPAPPSGFSGQRPQPRPPSPPRRPSPSRCVPNWWSCGGGKRCCGKHYGCRRYNGKLQCLPNWTRPRQCVPHWGACTGPRNRWGTSRCCGGWKCRWTNVRGFNAKRCEPARRWWR